MAYVKQNFVDGNVLNASELNHMEDGIGDAYIKPSGGIPSGDIANGAVTAAKIAANAVSTMYTATVPANGWSEAYGVYVSNVNISGILSADTPMVDIDMEEIDTLEDQKTANDEWGGVFRIKVFDGVLQFYATDAPTADIPIKILCVRK